MKMTILTLLVCSSVVLLAQQPAAPKTAPVPATLSASVKSHEQAAANWELQRQNIQLRLQLLQVEERLLNGQGEKLQAERDALDRQLKDAVKCMDPKCTVDWSQSPPVVAWPKE